MEYSATYISHCHGDEHMHLPQSDGASFRASSDFEVALECGLFFATIDFPARVYRLRLQNPLVV